MKNIMYFGFGLMLSLSLVSLAARAQDGTQTPDKSKSQGQASSGTSLGDYARHVRKDEGQVKARPKVFDNDNLPKEDKLSVVGAQPATVAENPSPAKPAEKTASAASDNKIAAESGKADEDAAQKQAAWKQWQSRIAAQRDQIDLMQRELDVMQREYQIRAAAFYADAGNRLRNSGPWDKQDADYKQQIALKQKALEEAKQKLDDMEEEARKSGVPASVREP